MQAVDTGFKILDGKEVSQSILDSLEKQIKSLKTSTGKTPGLAVVLVGDNPASQAYVGMKKKACEKVGMKSFEYRLPADTGEEKLIELIQQLNSDTNVNGILVQLPLPKGYDEDKMLNLIDPDKDVDGFHPVNVGRLLLGLDTFRSCTPAGVIEILNYYNIDTSGKHVVIIGRSNIVGKPLAAMMVQRGKGGDATVTICHSRTKNLVEIASQADILVAAIGQPLFVTKDMVKEGAVVIDVGINRVDDTATEKGYKLVGDVDFDAVKGKSSFITPVPGGVGPMTIAMLLKNTLQAFSLKK